jgi:hypothetical protein
VRGDLDLYFHQSTSSLSEGNIADLDLGVLYGFSLFFLSYSSNSFSLWWNLRVKDLSTLCALVISFGASV